MAEDLLSIVKLEFEEPSLPQGLDSFPGRQFDGVPKFEFSILEGFSLLMARFVFENGR